MTSAENLTADLPALVGTDEQIAWASDIRDHTAADLAATIRRFEGSPRGVLIPVWTELAARVLGITDTGWWIERRGSFTVANAITMAIAAVGRARFTPGMTPAEQIALLDADALFAEVTR